MIHLKSSLVATLSFALLALSQNTGIPPFEGELNIQPVADSSWCLTAESNTDGAIVDLQKCADTLIDSQGWTFQNGQVTAYGGTKCLDVTGGVDADGTLMQIWTCYSGDANQQWFYTGYGDNHLQWTNTGMCLDLPSGNIAAGQRIQVWGCDGNFNANQIWNLGYPYASVPYQSESGQAGYNQCGTGNSNSAYCQTIVMNSIEDFCLWAPPTEQDVSDAEQYEVAWCLQGGRGTRMIADGTFTGVHWVTTPDYVQVTGTGYFTNLNIPNLDEGGELDPHGATGTGNPIGGLIYGNSFGPNLQYHEWTSFIDYNQFCFRACIGPNSAKNCMHIYDEMGCDWNMPANYDTGTFDSCQADDSLPMGVYGTSTWYQGVSPTPPAHPVPASSSCTSFATITSHASGATTTTTTTTTSHTTTTTTGTTTTTSSGAAPTGKTIRPGNAPSMCLTVADSNGSQPSIEPCVSNAANQQWSYAGANQGTTITAYSGSQCLDVPSGNTTPGQAMQVWGCGPAGNANQQWWVTSDNRISWESHGECLDLTGGVTSAGNVVQMWTCTNGNLNQVWNFV